MPNAKPRRLGHEVGRLREATKLSTLFFTRLWLPRVRVNAGLIALLHEDLATVAPRYGLCLRLVDILQRYSVVWRQRYLSLLQRFLAATMIVSLAFFELGFRLTGHHRAVQVGRASLNILFLFTVSHQDHLGVIEATVRIANMLLWLQETTLVESPLNGLSLRLAISSTLIHQLVDRFPVFVDH